MKKLTPAQARYRDYLNSPHWQRTRARILARANNHCEWCGRFCGPNPHPDVRFCDNREDCEWCRFHFDNEGYSRENDAERLEVHHKTYERLGAERDEDLAAICWTCHDGITDRMIELRWRHKAGLIPRADATEEAARSRFLSVLLKALRLDRK